MFAAQADQHLPDERDLVARVRAGEGDALGEIYDLYHARVRNFARRIVGNDTHAEDLVQEVFIALPEAALSFEARSQFSTFLLGVTYNLARKHIRSAARKRAMATRLEAQPRTATVDGEHGAERAQLAQKLLLAMDDLPEEQRAAFTLMELEDYTSAEVAEIIGIPEGTVRTRVFHAKRKLREKLQSLQGEATP
jgi:RNA polymerase sigma-70 factor (ECF subfamily)